MGQQSLCMIGELKVETASYRDISDYFIKLSPKDTAPSAPSFDNNSDNSMDKNIPASNLSTSEESSDEESVRLLP